MPLLFLTFCMCFVLAARGETTALYCVGDLCHLPFQDATFDALINILSPADYGEFLRVLKKGGILIKVMPGSGYLQEIRSLLPLRQSMYDDTKVLTHLSEHMRVCHQQRLTYTLPVTPESFAHFTRMTPLTAHLNANQREALLDRPAAQITIDLLLAVCRQNQ